MSVIKLVAANLFPNQNSKVLYNIWGLIYQEKILFSTDLTVKKFGSVMIIAPKKFLTKSITMHSEQKNRT